MFLKKRNIISKIKRSDVTDYAALNRVWDVLSEVAERTWDVFSGAEKKALDVLSRVTKNCMGRFVGGGKLMRDVLSWVSKNGMGSFVPGCFVLHSCYIPIPKSNGLLVPEKKRFKFFYHIWAW